MEAKTIRTQNTEYVKISWQNEAKYNRWISMLQQVCKTGKKKMEKSQNCRISLFLGQKRMVVPENMWYVYIRRIWRKLLNSSSFSPESVISRGKMIGQKDSLLEKYRTYLYSTKKRYE